MLKRICGVGIAVTFLCIVSTVVCFAANEVIADSRITQVTVFPDSALLTRSASLKLPAGEYKILFADILPELDENSLRVSADAQSGVKIIGAQLKREFLPEVPSEKIKQLKDEMQKLQDEIRTLQNLKTIFSEEKEFLNSLRFFSKDQLPEELATRMPAPKDLDDTLKFLDIKLRENYAGVMDCEVKTRELAIKLDVVRRELEQISSVQRKMKRNIVVELIAEKSAQCVLDVSYLVRGASWQPIYDARADFNKGVVELVSHGIVSQKTGEDWNDVTMALSTARPTVGGRMPELISWFLRPFQPRVLMERNEGGFDRYAAKSMKSELAVMSDEEAGMMPAAAPLYAKAQEKGVAVVYTLPRKAEVKSDGSEHKLLVSSQMLEADFEYSTYPRVSPTVYLRSKVTNAKDLQLLAGRVNIFLEGDFVGASHIDSIGPGEKFDLYLGMDESVKIKRDLVEKKVDETLIGNIPSATKKTVFKYKLTVENYKSRNSKIKLFEAMPVPEDDRIKVKMGQVSLEPKVKDWEDKKGIWLWELELAPKAKQEITYSYTIEHPREMQVEGL